MKNHFSNASLDTKSSIAHIVMDQVLEIQVLFWILIKLYFAKVYKEKFKTDKHDINKLQRNINFKMF